MLSQQSNILSQAFENNMGVKRGCPMSPTLFGLCIDKLEEMINEIAAEEGTQGCQIGPLTILLLMYADDVVLLRHDINSMHKLLETPEF